MLQVVCVNVGPKFSADYTNRLYRGVKKHLTVPHDFVCITEKTDVECRRLDSARPDLWGWWQKVVLFSNLYNFVSNRILYMDLDVVIRGSIDFLAEVKAPFATLRDSSRPGMNSSVMLWDHDKFTYVYDQFPGPTHKWGDQGHIGTRVDPQFMDFYQLNSMPGHDVFWLNDHFRELMPDWKEDLMQRDPQGDERLVWTHGNPMPHLQPWVQKLWSEQE